VSLSLRFLGLTAVAQTIVFIASGSVALLADLIHNFGDALTAVPSASPSQLTLPRSPSGARPLAVVAAIFIRRVVAGAEAVQRLVHPSAPTHLPCFALAGRSDMRGTSSLPASVSAPDARLESAALIADGHMPAPTPTSASR